MKLIISRINLTYLIVKLANNTPFEFNNSPSNNYSIIKLKAFSNQQNWEEYLID